MLFDSIPFLIGKDVLRGFGPVDEQDVREHPASLSPDVAEMPGKHCVLMFSGGRDSSLAAVRLMKAGYTISLVTITSDHLFGIEAVEMRIIEMRGLLSARTDWKVIQQPPVLHTDTSFYKETCLPCHHAYVVVGFAVARALGASSLSFGYAGYQNHWPEQTPYAVERLRAIAKRHDMELLLPVYDVRSQESAESLLKNSGLSSRSLEQKCIRQINNVTLSPDELEAQVSLWEQAIEASIGVLDKIGIGIIRDTLVHEL